MMFELSPSGMAAATVYSGVLLYAAWSDVRTRRIPNRLVAVLAATGFVFSFLVRPEAATLLWSLKGLALGFGLWILPYAFGWLGAGDVKLFAAAGAWLGMNRVLDAAVAAAIIGGVLTVGWLVVRMGPGRSLVSMQMAARQARSFQRPEISGSVMDRVPYGIALSAGLLLAAWM